MTRVTGIDHVAITVADLDATCDFYARLLGFVALGDHAPAGRTLVRQIAVGGAMLSVHQRGNGVDLVARNPTPGSSDFCLRVAGDAEAVAEHLRAHGVAIVEGPARRRDATGGAGVSVYFLDPDGNLVELMAAA